MTKKRGRKPAAQASPAKLNDGEITLTEEQKTALRAVIGAMAKEDSSVVMFLKPLDRR